MLDVPRDTQPMPTCPFAAAMCGSCSLLLAADVEMTPGSTTIGPDESGMSLASPASCASGPASGLGRMAGELHATSRIGRNRIHPSYGPERGTSTRFVRITRRIVPSRFYQFRRGRARPVTEIHFRLPACCSPAYVTVGLGIVVHALPSQCTIMPLLAAGDLAPTMNASIGD